MSFADQLSSDMSVFFNMEDFAGLNTIVYAGVPITAVFDPGEELKDGKRALHDDAILWVQISEVASPAYRDSVTINGDTWRVDKVLYKNKQWAKLTVKKNVRGKY